MNRLSTEERFTQTDEILSPKIRARVEAARERQTKRFTGTGIPFNAAIPGGQVKQYCNFSDAGFAKYKEVVSSNTLSTRSMDRLAKVARTVADLVGNEQIEPPHIMKATKYVVGGMLRDAF